MLAGDCEAHGSKNRSKEQTQVLDMSIVVVLLNPLQTKESCVR